MHKLTAPAARACRVLVAADCVVQYVWYELVVVDVSRFVTSSLYVHT